MAFDKYCLHVGLPLCRVVGLGREHLWVSKGPVGRYGVWDALGSKAQYQQPKRSGKDKGGEGERESSLLFAILISVSVSITHRATLLWMESWFQFSTVLFWHTSKTDLLHLLKDTLLGGQRILLQVSRSHCPTSFLCSPSPVDGSRFLHFLSLHYLWFSFAFSIIYSLTYIIVSVKITDVVSVLLTTAWRSFLCPTNLSAICPPHYFADLISSSLSLTLDLIHKKYRR